MTASNFDGALRRVLEHEGGYIHHPADPGGATMKGVTQRVYDGWRARNGQRPRPVQRIGVDEVKAIYRRQYWEAVKGDELPPGLDYCLFDAAVHSGPAQATKWLQRCLGVVSDGQVGTVTLAALEGRSVASLVDAVCDRRLAMLRGLRTFPTFGRGWVRRVAEVRAWAVHMAQGLVREAEMSVSPVSSLSGDFPTSKALPADTRLSRTPEGAGGLLTGAAGLGLVLAEQADRLKPLIGMGAPLQWLLAVLMLGGVVLTLTGALRRIRAGEGVA